MNHLVIQVNTDIRELGNYCLFFVDTDLESVLFEQLLDLFMHKEITVYKKINNQYAEQLISNERQRIISGDSSNLEHYEKVDFLKNQFNKYLGIQKNKTASSEDKLNEFRKSKLKHYDLLLEKDKRLVIEVHKNTNKQLASDLNLFHHTVDATYLAFTNEPNKYFAYSDQLDDKEEVISKSNRDASNIYFLLPYSNQYKQVKKILFVNTIDYKTTYETVRNEDYILLLNDDLLSNQYVVNQCKENGIKTQVDFELGQARFIGQDMDMLLIIKMVESYGEVELYEYDGKNIIFIKTIQKNSYKYQKMILTYKNDLYYNCGTIR